jgi:MFS family permease
VTSAILALLMLIRGSTFGAIAPFATVLALRAGLPAGLLGPVAAAAAVITLVMSPLWGSAGDRRGRRRMLVLAFALGVPVSAAFASPWLVLFLAAYLAWAFVSSAFMPLVDSICLDRLGGSRSRYARVRAGASAGFIVTALAVGAAITVSSLAWAAPGVVGAVLCAIAAGGVAVRQRGELRSGTGVAGTGGPPVLAGVRSLVGRRRVLLTGLLLLFAAANAPGIFLGPRIVELGGSGWDIGVATAAGTIAELPAFLLVPFMLRHLGGRRLFVLAGFILGVSGALAAVVPTPLLVSLVRLGLGAGFAWMVVPALGALVGSARPTEQAAASALLSASGAAGSLLVAIIGLPLVGLAGSLSAVLLVAAFLAPIGALICARDWPVHRLSAVSG